jgi:hypothetical protein
MKRTESATLLIVGEVHGTREAPALVADLAKRWAAQKDAEQTRTIIVALEYPQSQEAQLKAYVDSDGGTIARQRLLESSFWSRPMQDGRSSQAMLALIDSVRTQFRNGSKVRLAAFDMNASQYASRANRDKAMADNLRSIVDANPSARVIALVGNYHARQRDGAPWDEKYRFMADHLKDLAPFSLNVDAIRGDFWVCSGGAVADCKVREFAHDPKESPPVGLYVDDNLRVIGYDQALMLEQFSASLPAREAH